MSEQWTWQPVASETEIRCDCGLCDRGIYADDDKIIIYDDVDNEQLSAHLPDGYALCRRVPAPGVPVEVRDALILAEDALAELIGADYDVDGSLAAVRAALALI